MELDPTAQSKANLSAKPSLPAALFHFFKSTTSWIIKSWLVVSSIVGTIVLIASFGFFFLFWFGSPPSDKVLSGSGSDKIAVVNLSGIIDESSSTGDLLSGTSETISPSLVQDYIDRITNDSTVKAVIFRLNSPGGTIVASDQINEKIEILKKKVKVVFLYGDVAASGGYYISAGADKVVANGATITGSIGVIAEVLNVKGLYDKLGLKEEVYKSGPNKDLLNPARDRTDEEKAIIQNLVSQSLDQFIDRVASGRKMDKEEVRKIADGRVYSGLDAKELGLVDELGNLDKAIEVAKKTAGLKDAQVIEYSQPGFLESLLAGKLRLNPLSLFNPNTSPSSGIKIQYLLSL